MARDYTKYLFNGGDFKIGKSKLAFELVSQYLSDHSDKSFEDLSEIFSNQIRTRGMISKLSDVTDAKRWHKTVLKDNDGTSFVVSNQWGTKNIGNVIDLCTTLGYSIESVDSNNTIGDSSNDDSAFGNLPSADLPDFMHYDWNPEWGRLITVELENAPEFQDDYYEKFTMSFSLTNKKVYGEETPAWSDEELEGEDKWFGNMTLLSEWNRESYESVMKIYLYDDSGDEIVDIYWHGGIEDINDGAIPEGLTEEVLKTILSGRNLSMLYDYIKRLA